MGAAIDLCASAGDNAVDERVFDSASGRAGQPDKTLLRVSVPAGEPDEAV